MVENSRNFEEFFQSLPIVGNFGQLWSKLTIFDHYASLWTIQGKKFQDTSIQFSLKWCKIGHLFGQEN